uniref:PDZ domain-containing protein n=1 Tax=Hydatigena taeniaeformis TaxID=6205 RepID=A0A0R3XBQ4_HYDTA
LIFLIDITSLGESSDWEYVEVVISRPAGKNVSFGFSVAGGYDAPQENGDPSIYVTRIAAGSIAEADDRLRPLDQIMSVNGIDLTCVSNQEAIIRRYTGPEAALSDGDLNAPITNVASPNSSNDEGTAVEDMYYEVSLLKPSVGVGLGFTIAGGQACEDYPGGIYVTKITPGGLAEEDGQIQPGDRLLQVNGQDLDNITHDAAVKLLRNAGTHVHLVLLRPRESTISPNFTSTLTSDYTINGNN